MATIVSIITSEKWLGYKVLTKYKKYRTNVYPTMVENTLVWGALLSTGSF
jgi:hypothetical protein